MPDRDRSDLSLPRKQRLGYGVGDVGGNMFFTIISFWLLDFFVDELCLTAAAAGAAILIGRVWDSISDPLMGAISDRTTTAFGRRRPYLLFGGILLVLAMAVLFLDVGRLGWGPTGLFIWASLAFVLAGTIYTVVFVPYGALTADLTRTYEERTQLTGYRMGFAIVGTLLGAGAFRPVVAALGGGGSGHTLAAVLFGAIMTAAILVTVVTVRERAPGAPQQTPIRYSIWKSYLEAMRFRPFLMAVAPWTLHMIGITVAASMVPFYFEHIHGRTELESLGSGGLLATAAVGIVLFVVYRDRVNKRVAYNAGMAVFGGALVLAFFFGHLDVGVLVALLLVAGFGLSSNYVMPWSILPDVIDADELEHGVRREGIFYGLWTFWMKLGLGVAGLLSGLVLTATGYAAGAVQTETAQLGIRLLIGPIPAAFFLIGIAVMARYPITKERHAEIVAGLDDSRARPSR